MTFRSAACAAALVLGVLPPVQGWAPGLALARLPRTAALARRGRELCATDDGPTGEDIPGPPKPGAEDEELSAQFNKFITGEAAASEVQGFNDDLYAHLNQRPEYETSELYKNLRKRVDVTDPMYKELEQVKWGELLDTAGPTAETTPGEAIETVLRALRDVDEPRVNYGLELLQRFSSSASALATTTPEQLRDYFEASKYGVLFDWTAIRYTRKLDLSFDKKRAVQQLRLTGRGGKTVPVTFQLSSYNGENGDIWLIDQLLVKSVDM